MCVVCVYICDCIVKFYCTNQNNCFLVEDTKLTDRRTMWEKCCDCKDFSHCPNNGIPTLFLICSLIWLWQHVNTLCAPLYTEWECLFVMYFSSMNFKMNALSLMTNSLLVPFDLSPSPCLVHVLDIWRNVKQTSYCCCCI